LFRDKPKIVRATQAPRLKSSIRLYLRNPPNLQFNDFFFSRKK